MPTYLNNCIRCGHEKFCRIEPYKSDRIDTNYVACLNCGLVVMNPMPTDDELKEYYSDDYWKLSGDAVKQSLQKQHLRARRIKKYVELNNPCFLLKDVSSILEIGSSFGVTLHHLGACVKGRGEAGLFAIEPSQNSVRIGRDYYEDVTIMGRTTEDLNKYNVTFHLIILSHVLEHFTNPVAELNRLANKISDNGLLYIEVPNFYGHPSVHYSHNYCFTENSLRNCLSAAEFEPVQIDLFFYSVSFPMYITCLARKITKPARPAKISKETVEEIIRQRKAGQTATKGLAH